MSVFASLAQAYGRLADQNQVPPVGYSRERIGFAISLNEDGIPVGGPVDLREGVNKTSPRLMAVPASFKRPGTIPRSFFLWDNSAFALGITGAQGKSGPSRFQAFRDRHVRDLSGTDDPGLKAILRFVMTWKPDDFSRLGWTEEIQDQNVVFTLQSERQPGLMIHDGPAARSLWARLLADDSGKKAACLVTGEYGSIARLHPAIKGVWGAQPSGGSIVSFNHDAFTSYGREQGDNAPVSAAAAFAYVTALNHFLTPDKGHRVQIGDTSAVFWAGGSDPKAAQAAESFFARLLGDDVATGAQKPGTSRAELQLRRSVQETSPLCLEGVPFFVLGLAPNVSRLSIRFFVADDFDTISGRWLSHLSRMRIEPQPKDPEPSMRRLLIETAPLGRTENIIPNLAGEWTRAILTGGRYPASLLTALLCRLRADHDVNAMRVAILKSVLYRNFPATAPPTSLDADRRDPGYLLGRLFAALEYAQWRAFPGITATIREYHYGMASGTPRASFPLLMRKATYHLARINESGFRSASWVSGLIDTIFRFGGGDHLFVRTLAVEHQALFAIGYYHQRSKFYRTADLDSSAVDE